MLYRAVLPAPTTKEIVSDTTDQNDPFAHLYRPEPEETTSSLDMKEVVHELGEGLTERFDPVTKKLPIAAVSVAPPVVRTPSRTQRLWVWLADWGFAKTLLLPTLAVCGLYIGMLLGAPESLPDFAVPPGLKAEAGAKPKPTQTPTKRKQEQTTNGPGDASWQLPTSSSQPTLSTSPSATLATPDKSASASPSASAPTETSVEPTTSPSPSTTPSASTTSAPSPTVTPTEQVPSTTPPATTTAPSSDSSSPMSVQPSEDAVTATP